MSDISEADADFIAESYLCSIRSRKRKKERKNNKKGVKDTNPANNILQTNSDMQKKKKKKKKTSKCKQTTEDMKEKKKERKRKNKEEKNTLNLDGSFALTQGYAQWQKCEQSAGKLAALNQSSAEELKQDHMVHMLAMKKTKSKKKVASDYTPGNIRIKRPKLIQHYFTDSNLTEDNVKKDIDRKLMVQSQSQGQPRDNNSQCIADDINSQDLFITQKTFRSSPEPSSVETNDQDVPVLTQQRKKSHTPPAQQTPNQKGSHTFPKDPQKQKEKNVVEKDLELHQASRKVKPPAKSNEENPSFQMQMEPIGHSCSETRKANTSTQTENFFTAELSCYLEFCQRSRVTVDLDLKPLNLSLPHRIRAATTSVMDLQDEDVKCTGAVKLSSPRDVKGDNGTESSSCSSQVKDSKESNGPRLLPRRTKGRSKTASSPDSEFERKSSDTMTSSEDSNGNDCKMVLTQFKSIQMKLNESFYFRTKGETQSPRPASPLMTLTQSKEMKNKK